MTYFVIFKTINEIVAVYFKKGMCVIAYRRKNSTESVAADATYIYQCPLKGSLTAATKLPPIIYNVNKCMCNLYIDWGE
jgi:hypothetical protein